jgi:hypothetical protein
VRKELWVDGDSKLPSISMWFICLVEGAGRIPLKWNKHNQFWVGIDGKTYQPNQIQKWLDA